MSSENEVGKNWSLYYREMYEPRIKRLTEKYREVYDENQMMKKRLEKYEKNRRMISYYNKKED